MNAGPLLRQRVRRQRRAAVQRLVDSVSLLSDSELLGLQWDVFEALRHGRPRGVARVAASAMAVLALESDRRGCASPFDLGDHTPRPPVSRAAASSDLPY